MKRSISKNLMSNCLTFRTHFAFSEICTAFFLILIRINEGRPICQKTEPHCTRKRKKLQNKKGWRLLSCFFSVLVSIVVDSYHSFLCIVLKNWKSLILHIVWKLLKMSHSNFWILAFSTNFCPIKGELSGNTVWPQASDFQKLAKIYHFWHF